MIFMIQIPAMCIVFGIVHQKLSPWAQSTVAALFDDVNIESNWARQYYSIFMIRRLLFTIVCIYIVDHGEFQSMLYIQMSIFNLMFVLSTWPMDLQRANILEVFNEYCILVCGYHLFLFTDFIEQDIVKWNAGWSIVLLTVLNILVNCAVAFYDALGQIGDYLQEHCSKKKYKDDQVLPLNESDMDQPEGKKYKGKKPEHVLKLEEIEQEMQVPQNRTVQFLSSNGYLAHSKAKKAELENTLKAKQPSITPLTIQRDVSPSVQERSHQRFSSVISMNENNATIGHINLDQTNIYSRDYAINHFEGYQNLMVDTQVNDTISQSPDHLKGKKNIQKIMKEEVAAENYFNL